MRKILFVSLALVALPVVADEEWLTARCQRRLGDTSATVPAVDQNASTLYALTSSPAIGCYASGSTALSPTGAAMTFTRSSIAYMATTPPSGSWTSCPANQLRVSGDWPGVLLDAEATNRLATPTDAPTHTSPWAPIATGTTCGAGNTFMDGTATSSVCAESAGIVNGIYQTLTTTANVYSMSAIFGGLGTRQTVMLAVDGTVWAKANIRQGYVTYQASGIVAGVDWLGNGWARFWAHGTSALTAASHNFQFASTNTADSTMDATTGGDWSIARAMVQKIDNYTPGHPTTYSAAGTPRTLETLSFQGLTLPADGAFCVSVKMRPYGATWDARTASSVFSLYGATTTSGTADSLYVTLSPTTAIFGVYDHAAAQKFVTMTFSTPIAGAPVPNNRPRVIKACVDGVGGMSLAVDRSLMTTAAGAGTGILTTLPTKVFVGAAAGSSTGVKTTTAAFSDLAICPGSDPESCGDWSLTDPKSWGVVGTSISTGYTAGGYVTSWVDVVGSILGVRVTHIDRVGWFSPYALNGITAACPLHGWSKVMVEMGTNDLGDNTMDSLRQIITMIHACGATPVVLTVMPRNDLNAAQTAARPRVNIALKRMGLELGFKVVDVAPLLDDGAGHLSTTACEGGSCDSGDGVHPGAAGHRVIGAAVVAALQ